MITLALIGIGNWGKNYLTTSKIFPNCHIKYICAKSAEALDRLDGNFITTTNYKDLFRYKDIDGVIIATPGSTHYQIAKEFIKKGFNLLIEKPLSTSYKQALQLKVLKNKSHAKILVGHTYLFDPAFIEMKKLIKQIGYLRSVSYEAVNNGPFRPDMSVLWDLGPHAVSLLLDIYEQNPIRIKTWVQNYLRPKTKFFDVINIEMEFTNKCNALIKIGWLSPIKRRELIIVGSESTLLYNDLIANRLTLFEGMGPEIKSKDIVRKVPKIKYPSYDQILPLQVELGEFINALSSNVIIKRSNLDFGIRVTHLLNMVEESIKKGGATVDVE